MADIAAIKELFHEADTDGDGSISIDELRDVFGALGDWTDEEFEVLFEEADVSGDGKLQLDEFVDWVMAEAGNDEEAAEELAEEALDALDGSDVSSDWEGEEGDSDMDDDSDWDDEDDEADWDDLPDSGEEDEEEVIGTEEGDEEDGLFKDPDFPATIKSIGKTEGDTASGVTGTQGSEWVRLSTYAGEDGALFKDIRPDDVEQGCLGNCWFLAAMASVASFPAWIKQIFSKNLEMQASGKYQVRLYHPGKKAFVFITVSDEVPATDGEPSFSSVTAKNEIWPCLIEKAFSKMCKTYALTEGGFTAFGMQYLCGSESEMWTKAEGGEEWTREAAKFAADDSFPIENRDDVENWEEKNGKDDALSPANLWKALIAYSEKNYPMACGISEKQPNMQGLIDGHAYSLTAVREVKTHAGKVLKMLKIRNPHGGSEWEGHWSDKSDMWNKHSNVKKELKFVAKEDGTFWMCMHDFNKYFDEVSVVKQSMPLEGCHEDKVRAVRANKKAAKTR